MSSSKFAVAAPKSAVAGDFFTCVYGINPTKHAPVGPPNSGRLGSPKFWPGQWDVWLQYGNWYLCRVWYILEVWCGGV